jgi:hypothetical protein
MKHQSAFRRIYDATSRQALTAEDLTVSGLAFYSGEDLIELPAAVALRDAIRAQQYSLLKLQIFIP